MPEGEFRFYAELNDFLPESRRQRAFIHRFWGTPSVKDVIESLGVPHTEVDLILVNGESVDFTYRVRQSDRVSVYPVFESLDIQPLLRLRPAPLRETRFVVDIHLGRLAAYLRMLGFDTRYENDATDAHLASVSTGEHRILLTKDRGLLKRSQVTHGYCVRGIGPRRQLTEIVQRFDLLGSIHPFQRCLRCNAALMHVEKGAVEDRLPPGVKQLHNEFRQCSACGKIYWKGSHYDRMQQLIRTQLFHDSRSHDT
jgi:uncharacterized protein with PIN domain